MTTPTLPKPDTRTYMAQMEDRLDLEPDNEIAHRLWMDLYYAHEFATEFETGCIQEDDRPATRWEPGECGCRVTEDEGHDAFVLALALKNGIRKAERETTRSPLLDELVGMAREAVFDLGLIRTGAPRSDAAWAIDSLREDLA